MSSIEALKRWRESGGTTRPPRNPLEIAADDPKSLRKAINAKCYECCCNSKREVGRCHITDCPLYPLRPKWGQK